MREGSGNVADVVSGDLIHFSRGDLLYFNRSTCANFLNPRVSPSFPLYRRVSPIVGTKFFQCDYRRYLSASRVKATALETAARSIFESLRAVGVGK